MTSKTLVILSHPQFQHSKANKLLIDIAKENDDYDILDLYETYPEFYIDVKIEQERLEKYDTIILQFPLQWYSCPALLKEWMDRVLERGWAFGDNTTTLEGKKLACAITTGGTKYSYSKKGHNRFCISDFLTPFDQTAHLCSMKYHNPFVVYKAHHLEEHETLKYRDDYKKWLEKLTS